MMEKKESKTKTGVAKEIIIIDSRYLEQQEKENLLVIPVLGMKKSGLTFQRLAPYVDTP